MFGRNFDLRAKRHPRRIHYRTRVLIRPLGTRRERTIMTIPGTDVYDYTTERDVDLQASAILGSRAAAAVYDRAENATELFLKRSGRPFRLLARGGFGEENAREFESPSFAGRYLYFGYSNWATDFDLPNGWAPRRDLRTATVAAAAPGYLEAVAADSLRPDDPPAVSSVAEQDPESGQPVGTDAVQTLDAPVWRTPPKIIHLR